MGKTQTQGEKQTVWVEDTFFSCSEPEASIGSFSVDGGVEGEEM